MKIKLKMFGALRQLGNEVEVDLSSDEATGEDVRHLLCEKFQGEDRILGILRRSVIANSQRVLLDGDQIILGETLSVLPPVCGG